MFIMNIFVALLTMDHDVDRESDNKELKITSCDSGNFLNGRELDTQGLQKKGSLELERKL